MSGGPVIVWVAVPVSSAFGIRKWVVLKVMKPFKPSDMTDKMSKKMMQRTTYTTLHYTTLHCICFTYSAPYNFFIQTYNKPTQSLTNLATYHNLNPIIKYSTTWIFASFDATFLTWKHDTCTEQYPPSASRDKITWLCSCVITIMLISACVKGDMASAPNEMSALIPFLLIIKSVFDSVIFSTLLSLSKVSH